MKSYIISKPTWQRTLSIITLMASVIVSGCETTFDNTGKTPASPQNSAKTTPALTVQTAKSDRARTIKKITAPKTKSQGIATASVHTPEKATKIHYPKKPVNVAQALALLRQHHRFTEHKVRALLSAYESKNLLQKDFAKLFHQYPDMSAYLLSLYARDASPANAITFGKQYHYDSKAMINLTFLAFPKNKLQLTKNLIYARNINSDDIISVALTQGVDPGKILPYSAANSEDYRITPLIESASITLYDRSEDDTATVQYKKASDSTWKSGMNLQWEPVDGTLTGSIVYLTAGTEYDVKVTVTTSAGDASTNTYTFTTWDDKPPIDSTKVYKLSDIYSGSGQLDLVALGISGSADGYAEIIGDADTPINDQTDAGWAVNIGSNSYIYFKNVTVVGGRKHAFRSSDAHNLWFDGCDVSGWGRVADYTIEGIGYDASTQQKINYDSAFALNQTGVVVVENTTVHDPRISANSWSYGHPYGPNAFLAWSNNSDSEYSGQVVIRNNKFYGSDDMRFNDVIESYYNGRVTGGFVRDSAIYNNYLAYSNDDIIELDGGQNNVLFYNNDISHAYCGVSVVPNMKGPSYVFNNYIHDLTDEDGNAWASIKAGGLLSRPEGKVNIFYNYIKTNTNGIASAGYDGDYTYWVNAQNNVMIHDAYWQINGYSIYDKSPSGESTFSDNYMFNIKAGSEVYDAEITEPFYDESLENADDAQTMWDSDATYVALPIPEDYQQANITKTDDDGNVIIGYQEEDEDSE